MSDDKKTLKFQMMMSPQEAERLDDWMFKNRLRSRAEAIRRLCQIGLQMEESTPAIEEVSEWFDAMIPKLLYAAEGDADLPYVKNALGAAISELWRLLAIMDEVWLAAELWTDAEQTDFAKLAIEVDRISKVLRGKSEGQQPDP